MKPLCSIIGILFVNSVFSQCPPTTPTITGTSVLCNGASGSLSVSGSGDTYTWSPGGANTASISISPTTTTTYSVLMGQTACTLTSSAAITVTVASTPTVVVSVPLFTTTANSFTVCGTGSQFPAFLASGASTYTWNTGAHTASLSAHIPFSVGQPPYDDVYTVTGQNACGTSTAAVTLTIYSFPTLSISASNTLICSGQPVTLQLSSTAPHIKWAVSGSTVVISTGLTTVVTPTMTTTYDVTVDNDVCFRSDEITIKVVSCTGSEELSGETGAGVYPNPVTELLYVDIAVNPDPAVLEVYDVAGKLLIRELVSGPRNAVQTDALQPGLYFYKVAGKTGKFIKQ